MNTQNLEKILISEEEISNRINELAAQLNKDFKDKEVILVSILKSSLYFMTDLSRKLKFPIKLDFLELNHYADEDNSGVIRVTRDLEFSISGKNVIIIENIIRTGLTHSYLLKNLSARNPKNISICTLLHISDNKLLDLPVHYTGFEIEDKFVVGYGLDYKEKYRNLAYIAEYKENPQS
ncbi:hypoxanthine phosphoribosyltransferase [Halanaerobium congolense]|jgi:hypoxanthine phosphoribosyltransferase|uniref:Hypoxanthine phosphoribosyltransferase n=1 Tax=Halanaerobium congolense TaxID=54121 RepID=A0A1M7MZG8_9FIRM|nr:MULTISPECIES: hypoxanthine phosphoribosyltransferase [Halanaerobium]KXS49390.1 MAG: Hypoxanthine-guanine phosphoribosyltransferase [Halanaerobium sp. T82-1]OEG63717.1 MAG: hypoxanthine phosphoribosyltransferase [Halanaerobium sp. MDAL1]PTX16088.1 hypoxanthine phosphoribosyltransferase [Halanaerobium congolense]PUU95116.1 MAG: Hypoxanthine-guanine phosphoribosyltransferase [Halanaerobium sp.]TDX36379.1 hypoxanthine phosphoribosyltransferase [Halanaerobium congolense]